MHAQIFAAGFRGTARPQKARIALDHFLDVRSGRTFQLMSVLNMCNSKDGRPDI